MNVNLQLQAEHASKDGSDLDAAMAALRDAAEAAGYVVVLCQRQSIPDPVAVA